MSDRAASVAILLIDDDIVQYQMLRGWLRQIHNSHYSLSHAISYADGLRALEAQQHDVYLIDQNLDSHSGLELLQISHARGYLRPIIFFTASTDSGVDDAAQKLGATDYLVKSEITPALFIRTLRYALNRAQTLRALRASEERLRRITDNMLDLIVQMNPEGRIEYASPSSWSVLGYAPEQLIGSPFQAFIHPEDADRTLIALASVGRAEYRAIHASGATIALETISATLWDTQHKMIGSVLATRDIGDRKRAEVALQQAKQSAEAANEAKSRFLSTMSHELRTPLTTILGYNELITSEAQSKGWTNLLPDLEQVDAAGRHLLSLINNVLDLAKIEAGHIEIAPDVFEITDLVQEVALSTTFLFQQNHNTFVVDCADDAGSMFSDMTKVRQILINLLGNAAKFTTAGTVILRAKRHNLESDHVTFEIEDTGIGIPAEQLERLFDEFEQVSATTARDYGGTGLGLAITRRFCQMLGGEITASSQVGVGSTFVVTLPALWEPDG